MNLSDKLQEICREFQIDGTFAGFETIQVGNVNRTYEVRFRMGDGNPKSFLLLIFYCSAETKMFPFLFPDYLFGKLSITIVSPIIAYSIRLENIPR